MCLKCLINKAACLGLLALIAGCHGTPQRPRLTPVYADLEVLAQRNPQWSGVQLYTQMIVRLQRSVRTADEGVNLPVPPVGIGEVQGLRLPGGVSALPQAVLAQQRSLLRRTEQAEVERLIQRRSEIRAIEIRAQARVWRRDARQQYRQKVAEIESDFEARYLSAMDKNGVTRLNLTLKIHALEQAIADWSLTPPPAPKLLQTRLALSKAQADLAALEAGQARDVAQLRQGMAQSLGEAEAARSAYVVTRTTQLEARLAAADEIAVTSQRDVLMDETDTVLAGEQILIDHTLAASGSLPSKRVASLRPAVIPVMGVESAANNLVRQRQRCIDHIYGDTQAAAEDAARQRGWIVTFGVKLPSERDRTSVLAGILAKTVWNTGSA